MKNLLYNSLIDSDFLLLADFKKTNVNLITKKIKFKNNSLLALDSFSILKTIKQMIRIIKSLQNNPQGSVIYIVLTSNSQFYFLLKTLFNKITSKRLEIKVENSLNFKTNLHTNSNFATNMVLNLDDFSRNSENFLLFKRLFSKNIFFLYKINSQVELNVLGSYKIYNNILNLKKIIFLIVLLKYFTSEKN
jgi:hypothetical protein